MEENTVESVGTDLSAGVDKVTVYELGFHIATTLPEEKLPAEVTAVKDVLEKAGVEFISEEFPKLVSLAYTIVKKTQSGTMKFDDAYFGWVKFAVDSGKLAEIKAGLESNSNIVRFLIIKTVRENTMPVKTFAKKEDGETAEGEGAATEEKTADKKEEKEA